MKIMPIRRRTLVLVLVTLLCGWAIALTAQTGNFPVSLQFRISDSSLVDKRDSKTHDKDASNVVAWLTPIRQGTNAVAENQQTRQPARMVQRNKSFEPHLLIVQVGSAIEFPNKDPFLHNVFSLFDGKRFDLGFYEAGSSKTLHFDKAGVSFLFCNIHPEMSGVIVSVATPYFGVSDSSGRVSIAAVPDGTYQLDLWYQRSSPEELKSLSKVVSISSSSRSIAAIDIVQDPNFTMDHKNKYGQDYIPPSESTPGYSHP